MTETRGADASPSRLPGDNPSPKKTTPPGIINPAARLF